jgi:hypothetical protein
MRDLQAARQPADEQPVAISATRPQTFDAAPAMPADPPPRPARAARPLPTPQPMSDVDVDAALHSKRRARQFAAAALRSSKSPTAAEMRKLVGAKIRDVDGRQLGRVHSLIADQNLAEGWVVVEEGRGGRRYYLPADRVDGAPGGAWTSLHRGQILETTAIVPNGRLTETSERLLRRHYAPTLTDRKHYSEVVARERLVRRSRAADAVQRGSQRLS